MLIKNIFRNAKASQLGAGFAAQLKYFSPLITI